MRKATDLSVSRRIFFAFLCFGLSGTAVAGKVCYIGKACGNICVPEYRVCTEQLGTSHGPTTVSDRPSFPGGAGPNNDGSSAVSAQTDDAMDTVGANLSISSESEIDSADQTQRGGPFSRDSAIRARNLGPSGDALTKRLMRSAGANLTGGAHRASEKLLMRAPMAGVDSAMQASMQGSGCMSGVEHCSAASKAGGMHAPGVRNKAPSSPLTNLRGTRGTTACQRAMGPDASVKYDTAARSYGFRARPNLRRSRVECAK